MQPPGTCPPGGIGDKHLGPVNNIGTASAHSRCADAALSDPAPGSIRQNALMDPLFKGPRMCFCSSFPAAITILPPSWSHKHPHIGALHLGPSSIIMAVVVVSSPMPPYSSGTCIICSPISIPSVDLLGIMPFFSIQDMGLDLLVINRINSTRLCWSQSYHIIHPFRLINLLSRV